MSGQLRSTGRASMSEVGIFAGPRAVNVWLCKQPWYVRLCDLLGGLGLHRSMPEKSQAPTHPAQSEPPNIAEFKIAPSSVRGGELDREGEQIRAQGSAGFRSPVGHARLHERPALHELSPIADLGMTGEGHKPLTSAKWMIPGIPGMVGTRCSWAFVGPGRRCRRLVIDPN
jgi:hypothetical protein